MTRRVEKCQCGNPVCQHWHVHPEAALQGVHFTETQARVVAAVLDAIEQIEPPIFIYDGPIYNRPLGRGIVLGNSVRAMLSDQLEEQIPEGESHLSIRVWRKT